MHNDFDGKCTMWDSVTGLPEGCDGEGICLVDEDPEPNCLNFESIYDDEVCDYCGEPLGFCAIDCETLDEEFEE